MFHIQKQRSAGVGTVGAVHAGQTEIDVVLGKHDLVNSGKQIRLILPHPQKFWRCKSGKCNVSRKPGQPVSAQRVVKPASLPGGAAVIPQDGGTDDLVVFVQHHQTVHLASRPNPRYLTGIKAPEELRNPFQHRPDPVLRILLAPSGPRKFQGIFLGHNALNGSLPVHQKQLDGGGAQVDSNIQHDTLLFCGRQTLVPPA